MLWFAIELSDYLHASFRTCEAAGLPVRLLEPADAARLFPAFSLDGVVAVLHDAEGGVLHARRATLALARLAAAAGASVRAGMAVRTIGDGVVELADGTRETADQVLVTTGAWTGGLLGAPIRSTQQVNVYLRIPTPGLPVWTYDLDVYGLSRRRRRGTQGRRSRGRSRRSTPTTLRRGRRRQRRWRGSPTPRGGGYRAWTGPAGQRLVRGADVCCYAMTASESPIVDRTGERTVVCAGFSGHGFKFAPTVAAAAADLVLGRAPEIDLAPFRFPVA